MPRRAPIVGLLVALVTLANAAGAAAKISGLPLAPQAMDGATIYGPGGPDGLEFGRFDVLTRVYAPLWTPPAGTLNMWDSTVASSYGAATLVSAYTETDDRGVFTLRRFSRSGAQKNLMSFPGDSGSCGRSLTPLEISSRGTVRALLVDQKQSGSGCVIDTAGTRLYEFPPTGKSRRLWLPPKYAALLLGGRLQTSGRWATLESGVIGLEDYDGAMLLDLTRKKKVLIFNPRHRYDTVTVRLGLNGAALVTANSGSTNTTILHSSPRARGKRVASSTTRSRSFLCGPYAATYSDYNSGVFERLTIRDMKGKQRFALVPPADQYLSPGICSAKYLLARDATLDRGDEDSEIKFGEIRLISLRNNLEAP